MSTLSPQRDDDLPIALRRTRRAGTPSRKASPGPSSSESRDAALRRSKRVRFSEASQLLAATTLTATTISTATSTSKTGITPLVRRTGLATPPPSKRRHATPATDGASPLHQVIDGRVQRKGRQCSEKLQAAARECNKQQLADEVARLRKDIQERDHQIHELRSASAAGGSDRIGDLEAQVGALTRQLADEKRRADREKRTPAPEGPSDQAWTPGSLSSTRLTEWAMLSRSPLAVGTYDADAVMGDTEETPTEVNTDDDDDDDASQDALMADLLGDKTRPPVCRMIVWPTASPGKRPQATPEPQEEEASPGLLSPSCARRPRMLSATSTSIRNSKSPRSPSRSRSPTRISKRSTSKSPARSLRSARSPFRSPTRNTPQNLLSISKNSPRSPFAGFSTLEPISRSTTPRASSPTPSATSTSSATPKATPISRWTTTNTGCQTTIFDDGDEPAMREELESLQRELGKMSKTLESYSSLHDRLASRMAGALSQVDFQNNDSIEQQLDTVLQLLADRTSVITHITTSLAGLGFSGSDASEMVLSLASALRSARLELEYLVPCETVPPPSSFGVQVLDLTLNRLRELGRRATEDQAALHHQLAASSNAISALNAEIMRAQTVVNAKTFRIQELEETVGHLKSALANYSSDVVRLEGHVCDMQSAARDAQASYARQLSQKDQRLHALEAQLASARNDAARSIGSQMRGEIDRLAGAVRQLRRENGSLKTRIMMHERQPLADAPNHLPTPKMDSAAVFGGGGADEDGDEDMLRYHLCEE